MDNSPLRIAFVAGVTPDKWARIWRERHGDTPLHLTPVEQAEQRRVLDDGEADMAFVRLPVDREGLHLIPLYEEQPVVVVGKEHPVAAYDEVPLADLADEQLVAGDVPGWSDLQRVAPLEFPEMTIKQAIEVVASGTGVAIVPMSLARLHHRKDVVHRQVLDVPTTQVGLAWSVDNDDPRLEDFIGIVRGRRANSSRGGAPAAEARPRKDAPAPRKRTASPRKGSKPVRGATASAPRRQVKKSRRRR